MGEISGCPRPQDVPTYAGSAVAYTSVYDASIVCDVSGWLPVSVGVSMSQTHAHDPDNSQGPEDGSGHGGIGPVRGSAGNCPRGPIMGSAEH
eukprot:5846115-Pyramimonas_sp.AAC.1